jgi:hypothetical protein
MVFGLGKKKPNNARKVNGPATAPKPNNARKVNAPKSNNARKVNGPATAPKPNNGGVTQLGSGTRIRNVTNAVMSLGAHAVKLGGTAYGMYLNTPTTDLLKIAAVCYIIISMAAALLERGTSPQIRMLKSNIRNAERALVQKKKNGMNIYRAYMKKGDINKASNYKNKLNQKHAPNHARIDAMKDELAQLRREIAKVATPSVNQVLQNTITNLTPVAATVLGIQAQIADTELKTIEAGTARNKARAAAERAQLETEQEKLELNMQRRVHNRVGPIVAAIKGVESGIQTAEKLGESAGTIRRAGQYALSAGTQGLAYGAAAAGAIGRFRERRAGRS